MDHCHFFVCTTHPGVATELEKILKEINFPFPYDIAFLDRVNASEDAIKAEFKKADVAISDPHVAPLLSDPQNSCPKLRWFQSVFAGVDNFQKMTPNPYGPEYAKLPFVVTRGATLYGPAMAEYALGALLMLQRSFLVYKELQPSKQSPWANRQPGLHFPLLSSQTIGILGASGSIGQDTARRFHTLGCKVWGLCRRHRKEGEAQLTPQVESHLNATLPPASNAFERMFALEDEKDESQSVLKEFLAGCDAIINVLPGTPETKYLLGGRTDKDGKPVPCPLQACKPNCIFINVGRGTIIKAESLVEALQKKWICHAVVCLLLSFLFFTSLLSFYSSSISFLSLSLSSHPHSSCVQTSSMCLKLNHFLKQAHLLLNSLPSRSPLLLMSPVPHKAILS